MHFFLFYPLLGCGINYILHIFVAHFSRSEAYIRII